MPTLPAIVALANLHSCATQTCGAPPNSSTIRARCLPSQSLAQAVEHGTLGLEQLDVEDSDLAVDPLANTGKKSGRTLRAVRSRLSPHVSQHSDVQRPTLTSVGNSDEEKARRAELKRLMHKRIQDELDKEHCGSVAGQTAEDIELSHHRLDRLPWSRDPCRDTNMGPVQGSGSLSDGLQVLPPPATKPLWPPKDERSNQANSAGARHDVRRKVATGQPFPNMASMLDQPSSTGPLSRSSSLIASHADDSPLLHGHASSTIGLDIDTHSQSWDELSALDVWLIADGLRSRDSSLADVSEPQKQQTAPSDRNQEFEDTQSHVPAGISVDFTPTEAFSPDAADLSAPLASWQWWTSSHASEQMMKYKPSHSSTSTTSLSDLSHEIHNQDSGCQSEQLHELSRDPPELDDDSQVDDASSNYPSARSSIPPSPVRSRANMHVLSTEDLRTLQLSPFQWHGNVSMLGDFAASEDCSSYATAEDDTPTASDDHDRKRFASDSALPNSSSCGPSETTSFRQREAELSTIQKRFGDVLAIGKPRLPVSSRFRENFEEDVDQSKHESTSLLDKLRLPLAGRSRHSLRVPFKTGRETLLPAFFAPEKASTRHAKLHKSNDELKSGPNERYPSFIGTNMDGVYESHHTQLHAERLQGNTLDFKRLRQVASNLFEGAFKEGQSMEALDPKVSKWRVSSRRESVSSTDTKSSCKPSRLTPTPDEIGVTTQYSRFDQLIQEWEGHMLGGQDAQAQVNGIANSRSTYSAKTPQPPWSWARYPIHTRETRIGPAGVEDHVTAKDFAISSVSSDGQLYWATDRPNGDSTELPESGSLRLLSNKLTKAVSTGMTRLFLNVAAGSQSKSNKPLERQRGGDPCREDEVLGMSTHFQDNGESAGDESYLALSKLAIQARESQKDWERYCTSRSANATPLQLRNSANVDDPTTSLQIVQFPSTPAAREAEAKVHEPRSSLATDEIFVTPLNQLTSETVASGRNTVLATTCRPVGIADHRRQTQSAWDLPTYMTNAFSQGKRSQTHPVVSSSRRGS